MRLSRRGWNNVLIFLVLAMILVFRLSDDRLSGAGDDKAKASSDSVVVDGQLALLPPNSIILEIDLPSRVIQRVGTTWRSQPSAARPVVTVDAWQHMRLKPWTKPIGAGVKGQSIQVFIAQSDTPLRLTLFKKGEHYFLTNWQGKLLQLDQADYQALFSRHP